MKKYTIIGDGKKRELDEFEFTKLLFDDMSERFYKLIETKYCNLRINSIYNNYKDFYSRRPLAVGNCRANNCNEDTIYSHSISKNAVLKNIVHKGKVYTPMQKNGTIVLSPVGIEKHASVFPRFCNNHDTKLFSELDKVNPAKYTELFFEQLIHRTIHREFYVFERNIEMAQRVLSSIKLGFHKIKDESIKTNKKIKDYNDSRFSISEDIKQIEDQINFDKHCIHNLKVFYEVQKPNQVIFEIIESSLPVAFSGIAKFFLNNMQINLVINCLPYEHHTVFVIAHTEQDTEYVENYILRNYDLNNKESLLEFIEFLSVQGTDNIFFDIEYWDTVPLDIKEKYIKSFSNFDKPDLTSKLDFSFLKWDYK